MNAALACPWCGAMLTTQLEDACPRCGATLVERRAANVSDPVGEPIVPVDPMLADLAPSAGERLTTSPATDSTSRSASAKAVLGQVVGADPALTEAMGSSPFSEEERELGFEPPSDAVRLEMHRMKVEALRSQLEAEATEYQYVVDAPGDVAPGDVAPGDVAPDEAAPADMASPADPAGPADPTASAEPAPDPASETPRPATDEPDSP